MALSDDSPAAILFDENGNPLATDPGTPAAKAIGIQGVPGGVPIPVSAVFTGGTVNQGAPNTDPNSWPVHQVGAAPLPTGAATEATLATRASEATVASILARLDVALSTRSSEATLAAVLLALAPLATEATAASILGRLDVALSTRASQVTVASILAQLDVALSTRASEATALAILGQLDVALSTRASEATLATRVADATITARLNTLGQKTMAASAPVVVASDQSSIPVTATIPGTVDVSDRAARKLGQAFLRNPGDTANMGDAANPVRVDPTGTTPQPVSQSGNWSVRNQDGAGNPLTSQASGGQRALDVGIDVAGVQVDPRQIRALTAADIVTSQQGTTPWADNVAQWGGAATSLGQKTMAASVPVAIASDQSAVPISNPNLDSPLSTLATSANQTNGTQKAIARGGAKGATVAADVTSTAEGADHQALDVQLYGSAGNAAAVTAANALKVDGSAVTQPVSGTVTANQGTTPWVGDLDQVGGSPVTTQAAGEQLVAVEGRAATGAAVVGNPVLAGGRDGSGNAQPIRMATDGTVRVDPTGTTTQPVSGTVTANQGTSPWVTQDNANGATGAAVPARAMQMGGSDGVNLQAARAFDTDTGGGTQYVMGVSLRKSALGGSVEAGTATDPLRIDPTGTTTQPVSDGGGSLTVDTPQLPAALVGGRLDTNVGAWLGSTAPTVGQKASASSIPIVVASDQSVLPENLTQIAGSPVTTQAAGEQLVGVEGRAASGAAATGNPVLSGGSDGANARSLLTDTSGRQRVVGAASSGAATAGDPVLVGGQDGANARSLLTDTSGRPNVVGAAAQGAAVVGNPVLVAGEDGSGNVSRLEVRTAPPVGTVVGQVVRSVVSQTATTSSVASNVASVTLLAANTARLGARIVNDGNRRLFVKCGATASATDYTKLLGAGEDWLVDVGYTGRVDGIWDVANGSARLTEYT